MLFMKTRNLVIVTFAVALLFGILGDTSNAQNKTQTKTAQKKEVKFRKVKNNAFTYGERFDYEVTYSFITAGTGYFQILPSPVVRAGGRECYDIRFQVESLKSLEWIYKVKDSFRSVIDSKGIFPWEFEQHTREGKFEKDYAAYFDQVNNVAYVEDKKYTISPYMHDIVSAFYYVRTQNIGSMPKGSVFYLKNFFDDKSYELGVKVHGKQTVEVAAGKFNCVIVEPLVVEGGLFRSEGDIFIWLTDDENKMPVKVSTKIVIGYVSAELVKYSGMRNPVSSKVD
jgi:hypothetical protein